MGALPLLEVADGLDTKGEVVIELVTHTCGVTKTWFTTCARDEANEIKDDAGVMSEVAFYDEAIVPAALAMSVDTAV